MDTSTATFLDCQAFLRSGVSPILPDLSDFGESPVHNFQADRVSLDEPMPADNVYRKLEGTLDLNFVRDLVKPFCKSIGRPSIDPVVFSNSLERIEELKAQLES